MGEQEADLVQRVLEKAEEIRRELEEKFQEAARETETLKRYLTEGWPPKLPSGAAEVRMILGPLRRFFSMNEMGFTCGDLSSVLTAAVATCIADLALEAAKYAESEARYEYLEWWAYVKDLENRLRWLRSLPDKLGKVPVP